MLTLRQEIELNREFESTEEELLLALLRTHQLLERASAEFLEPHALTAMQLNALMIVRDYEEEGLKQRDLARRLLINRASAGSLVDVLERRDLLRRLVVPDDRRAYHLELTGPGRDVLDRLLPSYYAELKTAFGAFRPPEKRGALRFLSRLREVLRARQRSSETLQ